MLYKMKAPGVFQGSVVEHTFNEVVYVKNGIAICRSASAKDTLYYRGYDLIEELPIVLSVGDKIPDNLYFETPRTTADEVKLHLDLSTPREEK